MCFTLFLYLCLCLWIVGCVVFVLCLCRIVFCFVGCVVLCCTQLCQTSVLYCAKRLCCPWPMYSAGKKISLAHFLVTVVVTGRRGGNERDPSSPPPSQLFARPIPTLQAKYSLKRTETPAIQPICLPLVVSILCGIAGAVCLHVAIYNKQQHDNSKTMAFISRTKHFFYWKACEVLSSTLLSTWLYWTLW